MPCWSSVSIDFHDTPRPPISQQACDDSSSLTSKSLPFFTKVHHKFHVFSGTVSGTPFSHFFQHDDQKRGFLDPLRNPLGPKMASKILRFPKKCQIIKFTRPPGPARIHQIQYKSLSGWHFAALTFFCFALVRHFSYFQKKMSETTLQMRRFKYLEKRRADETFTFFMPI